MDNKYLYLYLKSWLIEMFPDVQLEAWFSDIMPANRNYRADFCIPTQKIIIEVNGGNFINGRHNRGASYEKDLQKLNLASKNGWKVFQYTYPMIERKEFFQLSDFSYIEQYEKLKNVKLICQSSELQGLKVKKSGYDQLLSHKIWFFDGESMLNYANIVSKCTVCLDNCF